MSGNTLSCSMGLSVVHLRNSILKKVSIAELRILGLVNGNTDKDRIKYGNIRCQLEVAPIADKMIEAWLRWFGHVQRRLIDATMRKIDCLGIPRTSRVKGRPRETWIDMVSNYLEALN